MSAFVAFEFRRTTDRTDVKVRRVSHPAEVGYEPICIPFNVTAAQAAVLDTNGAARRALANMFQIGYRTTGVLSPDLITMPAEIKGLVPTVIHLARELAQSEQVGGDDDLEQTLTM